MHDKPHCHLLSRRALAPQLVCGMCSTAGLSQKSHLNSQDCVDELAEPFWMAKCKLPHDVTINHCAQSCKDR